MKQKATFFLLGVVLLGLFAGFSKYVKRGGLKKLDFDVTVKLQDNIPSRFDQLMDDGAILADGIVSSVLVLSITAWVCIGTKKKRFFLGAAAIPLAFFVLGVLEIYGKNMLPHPGPPFFMVKQPTTIFPKFHVVQPYSYPSGHAARSTFLGVIVGAIVFKRFASMPQKRKLFIFLIAGYCVFVWVSRIYLGHHWLSDIVGGVLLGASVSLAAVGVLNLLFRGSIMQKQ
ncbi:phosphatase PAP2 family protein [Candidatus Gottesmanbacteria bacterium]|nr:phosphatase PAP2 family protein [Candidatus Gottesmanbacteria bacterium]